jgi:MFS transporter, DHA2 family, methylenomycin A resistance protein
MPGSRTIHQPDRRLHDASPQDASQTSPWLVLTVMCVGYFLVLLDVTIVNVALPDIGRHLGGGVAGLQWVVDGYALALASLLLAGGTAGDLRGHKRIVLRGLVLFGAGSLACGLAPGIGFLVAARVFQGIGAALMLPGTLAIISRAFPERGQQARAIGIWAAIGSIALPVGPLLGGVLVQGFGWRSVFLLNVPLVAFAIVAAARTVEESRNEAARRFDRVGTTLGAGLLAAATFTVIRAGERGFDPLVGAGAVLTIALVAGFLRVERAGADPMLPLGLFRRRAFRAANAAAGVMNFATLGLLFLLTQYLQGIRHHSALAAGIALLPLAAPLSLLSPLTGHLNARLGPKLPMLLGLVLLAASGVTLLDVSPSSGFGGLLPTLLLWGIGIGLLTPAVVAAAVASVEPERAGLASGVNNTARQTGGVFGIAIFGAIAGSAANAGNFTSGMHVAGLLAASLFGLTALAITRVQWRGAAADL